MDPHRPQTSTPVYIVEGDGAVRHALAVALRAAGFDVEAFATGEAFLEREDPGAEGCLVLDEGLPGVSGADALRVLRTRRIDLPVILATNGPGAAPRDALTDAKVLFLEKPVTGQTLVRAIQQLLDARPARRPAC